MRHASGFTFLAAATLCLTGAARGGAWLESRHDHYSVFYRAGFEKDAALAASWADRAEQLMKDKYGVTVSHYRLSIYLYDAPTPKIDADNARLHCCRKGDGADSVGTIELVTPSAPAFRAVARMSSLGMPKNDESYHAKILMSELIPIGHYELQNARPAGGWKYYSAPNWFVQGLQEYDAIFHTTATNQDITARHLAAWATTHRGAISCCSPEIAVTDDYNGGATFMRFLAARFGEDVHAKLLRSSAPTFSDALSEVTKPLSRPELFAQFEQWVAEGAGAVRPANGGR